MAKPKLIVLAFMRAVLQRVKEATVRTDGQVVSQIGPGILVFLGVEKGDGRDDASYLASKIISLRVFADECGKSNLSIREVGGRILVVSQFTLLADCRKGKRPSFDRAAPPALARDLYETFIAELQRHGIPVAEGKFQATMEVSLINDGPVTILLDSKRII